MTTESVSIALTIVTNPGDRTATAEVLRDVAAHIEQYGYLSSMVLDRSGMSVGDLVCYRTPASERLRYGNGVEA